MIKSMTGFGRCEISEGEQKITVEIKSVNHRYLDLSLKMPKKLNFFDSAVRTVLKEYIERGKVDLFVSYEDSGAGKTALMYYPEIAAQYMEFFGRMERDFGLKNDITVSVLAQCPEVLAMETQQEDAEKIWHMLERALRGACERFVEARAREGEALKNDLLAKLDEMVKLVAFIEERSPQVLAEYRHRLETKVKEFLGGIQIDENRILAETVIFADKICVDEEAVRLKSHVEATREALKSGGSVGRKLDFIAQEMNREANTMLSKANDLAIADYAIELKTAIEKVREQIQNIE